MVYNGLGHLCSTPCRAMRFQVLGRRAGDSGWSLGDSISTVSGPWERRWRRCRRMGGVYKRRVGHTLAVILKGVREGPTGKCKKWSTVRCAGMGKY